MKQIFIGLLALFLSVSTLPAQDRAAVDAVSKAMVSVGKKDWDTARKAVNPAGQIGIDIVDWHRLRELNGSFDEYVTFLNRRSDWPGLPLLRKSGESKIPKNASPSKIIDYFVDQPPQTGDAVCQRVHCNHPTQPARVFRRKKRS